eukprot:1179904-Prorocentrum_minimum.AAC.1
MNQTNMLTFNKDGFDTLGFGPRAGRCCSNDIGPRATSTGSSRGLNLLKRAAQAPPPAHEVPCVSRVEHVTDGARLVHLVVFWVGANQHAHTPIGMYLRDQVPHHQRVEEGAHVDVDAVAHYRGEFRTPSASRRQLFDPPFKRGVRGRSPSNRVIFHAVTNECTHPEKSLDEDHRG